MGQLKPDMVDGSARKFAPSAVAINGKFLGAPFTAVHRVASELVSGMDRLRQRGAYRQFDAEVIRTTGFPEPPAFETFPVRAVGSFKGQAWEQIELPFASRGRLLVNLCNLAPVAVSRAVTLIHDAQVFSSPESYSWAFAAWYRAIYRANGRRHVIVTVSEFSRQELVRYGVARAENINVISNGVDHMLRTPANGSVIEKLGLTGRPFVLAIANAQPHKNVGLLLRAFSRPELADVRLVLFGASEPTAFKTADQTISDNVVFAGKISDAELRALMEASVCTAFPSRTEGFGMPPLEGMLLGAPAIISPCGALPEVCGSAALVADPDSPEAWANAILSLVNDGELRGRLSAAGVAHAAAFTWDRAAGALLDLIASLASGAHSDAGFPDTALTGTR